MGGLFGYNFRPGSIQPESRAILGTVLAKLNGALGTDSCGVVAVKDNKLEISRNLGSIEFHPYLLIGSDNIFVHARSLTTGKKIIEHAHPFEVGNTIGAHTGRVENWNELNRKYNRRCEVDSEHIFHHLNDGKDLSDINGFGAIGWLHKNDLSKTYLLNLDDEDFLSIFGVGNRETKETYGVVWSSSDKHLVEALYCAGIKEFFPYRVHPDTVYYVSNGEVFIATLKPVSFDPNIAPMSTEELSKWNSNTSL